MHPAVGVLHNMLKSTKKDDLSYFVRVEEVVRSQNITDPENCHAANRKSGEVYLALFHLRV